MESILISMHFQSEIGAALLMESLTEVFEVHLTRCEDASTAIYHKDGTVTLTFLKILAGHDGRSSLFWHALSATHFPGVQVLGLSPAPSQLPMLHMDALFMQDLDKELQPGTSAIIFIIKDEWSHELIKMLQGYNGQLYYAPLSPEDSALLIVQSA